MGVLPSYMTFPNRHCALKAVPREGSAGWSLLDGQQALKLYLAYVMMPVHVRGFELANAVEIACGLSIGVWRGCRWCC
jgi:hypothetical protein